MPVDPAAARTFIYANGRLLERVVHACLFESGDTTAVVRAIRAYQNGDGGLGHGLEPDKRCPASQPLDVETGLERLASVGAGGDDAAALVRSACDYLETVADSDGAVPVLLPTIAGYPRAPHWAETDSYAPGLNPTAGIVGYTRALGVDHPWVDRATTYCLAALESDGAPPEAHTLTCVARFLDHACDPETAASLADALRPGVEGSTFLQLRPDPARYGVTPLDLAPFPTSVARSWFDEMTITAHLDHLEQQQEGDGGWPVLWQPPSEGSRWEWRAIRTLQALRVLSAYGRLPAPSRE